MDLGDGVCHVHVRPCPDPAVQYSTGRHHEKLVSKSTGTLRTNATKAKTRHNQNAVGSFICPYIYDNTSEYRLLFER